MEVVNVLPNGNAPSGLSVGDVVRTGGGNYQIVAPGTAGASYNPDSGYWSMKSGDIPYYIGQYNEALSNASRNSALSQTYAREQMAFQTAANAKAMSFSAEEAEKARQWQEYMSNTAHQREVLDLVRAGLNPVLSANTGASTPSGASAAGVTSAGAQGSVDTSVNSVLGGLLSALINQATTMDVANINRQTALETTFMNNEASKTIASLGADATKIAAALNSGATKFAATTQQETQRKYSEYGILGDFLQHLITTEDGSAKGAALVGDTLNGAANSLIDFFKKQYGLDDEIDFGKSGSFDFDTNRQGVKKGSKFQAK